MTDTELAALDASHALHLLRRGDLGALEYAQALMRCMHARAGLHAAIGFF